MEVYIHNHVTFPACTNLPNVAIQQNMPGCACFLPNDLCTRLGYLGRLHVMADSEDTSDEEDMHGSQLHITCRSIRNWDQNGININILFTSWSRIFSNDKHQGINDTKEAHKPFCPLNYCNFKWSRASKGWWSDQVQILPIKDLDSSHKRFRR